MSGLEQQLFLNAGDALFASLEQETLACLSNLESMPAQEIERFCEKRQGILDDIEKFNTSFNHRFDHLEGSGKNGSLKKFRQRQTALLSRVIEADGLLIAFAETGLKSIKSKQAAISRGRCALHGYHEEGGKSRSSLKQIA